MLGRYHAFAFDPTNEEKLHGSNNFLTSIQELFDCINVNDTWKPYQTGVWLLKRLWTFRKLIWKNTITIMA